MPGLDAVSLSTEESMNSMHNNSSALQCGKIQLAVPKDGIFEFRFVALDFVMSIPLSAVPKPTFMA